MFNLNNHMFWSILSDSRQNRFFGRSNRIDYCGLVPFNLMYYCTGETQAIDLCGFISRIRLTKIKCAINTKHQKQKKKKAQTETKCGRFFPVISFIDVNGKCGDRQYMEDIRKGGNQNRLKSVFLVFGVNGGSNCIILLYRCAEVGIFPARKQQKRIDVMRKYISNVSYDLQYTYIVWLSITMM